MSRRFTDQQLFAVRNHIAVKEVIDNLLGIPWQVVGGIFRFRCPLCAQYKTAIKAETNLARCFYCKKNFNVIDLYMLVRHTDFVETVTMLIKYKNGMDGGEKPDVKPPIKPKANNAPVAVAEIIPQLIDKLSHGMKKGDDSKESMRNFFSAVDIAELESIVHTLSQLVRQLKAFHHNQF
jgi:hypothetical protein